VPKTNQTASGTVQALIEGPGEYGYAVYRTIPEGTSLRGVSLENGIATVDFSSQFAEAANRNASVRSVVESLTTLSTIRGVRFEVEGRSLGEWWGAPYGDVYLRPAINPE
jgi:spore germination protein GerM